MFINLTPHAVTVDGVTFDAPEKGAAIPRIAEIKEPIVGELPNFARMFTFETVSYGEVTNLPDPKWGVFYIVSRMVAERLPERRDLVFPSGLIRDDSGNIIGSAAFGQTPPPKI